MRENVDGRFLRCLKPWYTKWINLMWKIVGQQTMGETCFRCCNLFGWYMWDFPSGKFRWHIMFQMFKMDPQVMAPMVDWTFLKTQIIDPYYSTYDMIAALIGQERWSTPRHQRQFRLFQCILWCDTTSPEQRDLPILSDNRTSDNRTRRNQNGSFNEFYLGGARLLQQ